MSSPGRTAKQSVGYRKQETIASTGGAARFSFTTGSSTIGAPYGGKKTTESKGTGHRAAAEDRRGLDWAGGCGTAGGGAAGRGRRTPWRGPGRRRGRASPLTG